MPIVADWQCCAIGMNLEYDLGIMITLSVTQSLFQLLLLAIVNEFSAFSIATDRVRTHSCICALGY